MTSMASESLPRGGQSGIENFNIPGLCCPFYHDVGKLCHLVWPDCEVGCASIDFSSLSELQKESYKSYRKIRAFLYWLHRLDVYNMPSNIFQWWIHQFPLWFVFLIFQLCFSINPHPNPSTPPGTGALRTRRFFQGAASFASSWR